MTRALSLESGSIVPSVSQVAILPSSRSTQGLIGDAASSSSSSSYDAFFDQLYNYDQLLSTRSRLRTNSIWSSSSSPPSSTTTRASSSSDTNTRTRSDHFESRHDSFPSLDDDDDRPDTITDVNTSDTPHTNKASSTTTTNKRHFLIRSKKITSSNLSESNLDSDDLPESSFKSSSSSSGSGSGGTSGKVIQALDLSSIPVLTAPSITDPAPAPVPTDQGRRNSKRKLSSASDDTSEAPPLSTFTHRQPHARSPPPSSSSSSSGLISEIMQSESYQIAIGASPKQRHSVSSTSSAMVLRPQAILGGRDHRGPVDGDEDKEIDKSEIEITISPTGRSSSLSLLPDSSRDPDTMLATVEVLSVPVSNHAKEPSVLTEVITTTPSFALALLDRSPDDMYQAASRTLGDIQETRIQMVDLDDQNSALFRKVRILLVVSVLLAYYMFLSKLMHL